MKEMRRDADVSDARPLPPVTTTATAAAAGAGLPLPHPAAFRDEGMVLKRPRLLSSPGAPYACPAALRPPSTPAHAARRPPVYARQCFTERRSRNSHYVFGPRLGEGSFGEVFRVTDRVTSKQYALKIAKSTSHQTSQKHELETLHRLATIGDHPNIVKVHDAWEEEWRIHILCELCEGGSLENWIAQNNDVLTEDTILRLFSQVISGLHHLHSHDIVHMDISPGNLLLTAQMEIKISDFGLSYSLHDTSRSVIEGDSRYMAPETLKSASGWGKPADIFSVGVILYELSTNFKIPSNGEAWRVLRSGNPVFPPDFRYSDRLRSLILSMLNPDPSMRPTVDALMCDTLVQTAASPLHKTTMSRISRQLSFTEFAARQ
eukprot:m51a1_g9560 putative membrane-associated tyrosine- and threonine-specific cdc2-inhibitory kinase (376) ;mRNA; r:901771-903405